MYIVEIILKGSPVALTVQKKEEGAAKAAYEQLMEALKSGDATTVELTCEHQQGKTLCVLTSEVAAVQLSDKSGPGTTMGRQPGFFAVSAQQ